MCDINYNGVAIGSYARKIVRRYVERPDLWENPQVVIDALEVINPLVNSVIVE